MTVELVYTKTFDENNNSKSLKPQSIFGEIIKYLPTDLIPNVTIIVQSSGYITIKPMRLSRIDWRRLNISIKRMGGIWVSNYRFSHWSIPFSVNN